MASDPRYEIVVSDDRELEGPLLVGLSNFGLAGLTAVDHLTTQLEFEQVGHVRARNVPSVAPFEDGTPRHPMRLYAAPDRDHCVLLGEIVVPVWAGPALADAVENLAASSELEEVTLLHGVPFPHGPDEHALFFVATPEYRDRRLEGTDLGPLRGGVLDGVPGEFTSRSLAGELPPTGTVVTPIHPPGPDFEAAIRYLAFLREEYGLEVEDERLRERSESMNRYYGELADRMEAIEAGGAEERHLPIDRMFM
ncbi:proteasome assembly chaperone family protein [Natronococcus sp. JC468]|uniref:proteasome assembly chaperone family protein n=1 Tax=Natronococcus sp. JC468 TaxID=1961921 RepID=UPI00143BBDBF|nr:PAC2 family protein [Natronococcus sp. JC468]NKE36923.1 proteasome assembly chaperone family protein [Natronococcus sp. JC468]